MKKILICLLTFLTITTVSAKEPSYNLETKINITNDNTMEFFYKMMVNDEFLYKYDADLETLFNRETYKISLDSRNFKVESIATNEAGGLIIYKNYPNLEAISKRDKFELDLTKIEGDDFNDDFYFRVKSGIIYDKYIGTFVFDYTKALNNEDIKRDDLSKLLNFTFEVNIPSEAIKYNATTINDKKTYLKWNLAPGKTTKATFEFKQINTTRLLIILLIGTILVITLIVFIVKKVSNKLDEVDRLPKEKKKPKEKKQKNNIYKNGMIETVTADSLTESKKQQTEEKTNVYANTSYYGTTNNQAVEKPAPEVQTNHQEQAPKVQTKPQGYNPVNDFGTNLNNQEQTDYTNIFNQTFDDNKKGE